MRSEAFEKVGPLESVEEGTVGDTGVVIAERIVVGKVANWEGWCMLLEAVEERGSWWVL